MQTSQGFPKFKNGQLVEVTHLPKYMAHFTKGKAIVLYTYEEKYGDIAEPLDPEDGEHNYGLAFVNDDMEILSESSWYGESLLTLVSEKVYVLKFEVQDAN